MKLIELLWEKVDAIPRKQYGFVLFPDNDLLRFGIVFEKRKDYI